MRGAKRIINDWSAINSTANSLLAELMSTKPSRIEVSKSEERRRNSLSSTVGRARSLTSAARALAAATRCRVFVAAAAPSERETLWREAGGDWRGTLEKERREYKQTEQREREEVESEREEERERRARKRLMEREREDEERTEEKERREGDEREKERQKERREEEEDDPEQNVQVKRDEERPKKDNRKCTDPNFDLSSFEL